MAFEDAIGVVTHEKSTAPGKVNLRDYDFERPRLQLDSKAEGDDAAEQSLEVYHYPGRFKEPADGDRLAKVLLDSLRARREVVAGPTNTLRLHPGQKFQLDQHPYAPLNQEYLVLEVAIAFELEQHAEERRAREADHAGSLSGSLPTLTAGGKGARPRSARSGSRSVRFRRRRLPIVRRAWRVRWWRRERRWR